MIKIHYWQGIYPVTIDGHFEDFIYADKEIEFNDNEVIKHRYTNGISYAIYRYQKPYPILRNKIIKEIWWVEHDNTT